MRSKPLTVGEVTEHLRQLIDADETLSDVWIEGEVVQATASGAGHHYFTIADDEAKLQCVLFRSAAVRQRYLPSIGQGCAVHGRVTIYAREGKYQMVADFLRPAGIGLAALQFELLRQQLTAEGLFDVARKRPLPDRVRVVGLVTSAEGAVRHDVETVLRRRNPFLHLILASATVQGESAPASMRQALDRLIADRRCDVIIIGRGGGSSTDLAAFNDEQLVRSVFASPVPVVSAVGHETDWTLLDLVADLRAATPSAAAEIVSTEHDRLARELGQTLIRHQQIVRRNIIDQLLDVSRRREQLAKSGPQAALADARLRVDDLSETMHQYAAVSIASRRESLARFGDSLSHRVHATADHARRATETSASLLAVLDPRATLNRGYVALTDLATGLPILSAGEAQTGERMIAYMRDGSITAVVESVQAGATL